MTAVTYNIRLDQELRDEAFEVLDSYGLTPSEAIKLFLKQVAKTRTVPLTFDYRKAVAECNIQIHRRLPTCNHEK